MAEILTAAQLRRLTEHRYSSQGMSVTEPMMQRFWRWLVEQLPLWWAPNAMTLAGLMINVVTTLILIIYSPDAQSEAPRTAYLLCGVGLFLYQTLDATDGKQARRTASSSPLGELFDHGCDCVSIVFVALGMSIAIELGSTPSYLFFECFSTMFIFYAAHWQTYCTGTLKFGKIDVTEAQFSVIVMYFISALFGPSIWSTTVPFLNVEMKLIPLIGSGIGTFFCGQMYFSIIIMRGGVGKNGSTVAGTSVLSPMIPIGIIMLAAFVIWQKSPSQVYENHPVLYILSFGMAVTKTTNRLVVAHMTKSEMHLLDSTFIGPGMLFLNQYFNTVISEYVVLWMFFLYCTADLLRYSFSVCRQICFYLDIRCFTIAPSPAAVERNSVGHAPAVAAGHAPATAAGHAPATATGSAPGSPSRGSSTSERVAQSAPLTRLRLRQSTGSS